MVGRGVRVKMSARTNTEVTIGGKVFTLSGYESEDYLQKVAAYINSKTAEYNKVDSFRRQPPDTQNVLLQLNIADDYFKAKKQAEIFEHDLQQKDQEMYELKHELIALRMKIEETEKNAQEAQQQKELLEGKVKELNDEIDKLLK